jgi:N-methylhydantoinase A
VTTSGFEDVLHVGRGQRDDLHALQPRRTAPLVDRERCIGVEERMGANGRTVRPLADRDIERAVQEVRRRGAEAVAVCLLHAPRAPRHERKLAKTLAKALREDGLTVHASADLSADGREAERAATAVLDAYVGPVVTAYVQRVARSMPRGALTVMRSDGGRMSASEVRRAPVRTLLSGPAAGVAAAHALARRLGLEGALSFDVGGTSTDVAWLAGDDPEVQAELSVGAHRASVPSLALETVGAGGGSVVWLDDGGALRVGPASAGADPGPACYGRGGPFTLTDAWLLLQRLPDGLLDGAFPLDPHAAHEVARPLARETGMTVPALARGAVRVAAATTARALRRASTTRGHDPRGGALVAFGGAGPMLAAETAELLDLASVVVPADPGTFAAEGTLVAPLRVDAARAVTRSDAASLARLETALRKEVRARLERQGAQRVRLAVEVEARYAGQGFEVSVPFGKGWAGRFHAQHARRYGFADERREVEVVRLRVRGSGLEHPAARKTRRAPSSRRGTTWRARASLRRAGLEPNDRVFGPARIEEHTATTYVPAGWFARAAQDGVLILERVG